VSVSVEKMMGKYAQALDVYRRAAALAQMMKNWKAEASTYDAVGTISLLMGQLPQAMTYFEHELVCAQQGAEEAAAKKVRDEDCDRSKMHANGQLGLTCLMMSRANFASPTENLQKACTWVERQMYYTQKLGDMSAFAHASYNLGTCWWELCLRFSASNPGEMSVDGRTLQQALDRSTLMFHRTLETAEKNSHLKLQHIAIACRRELAKCSLMQGQESKAITFLEQYLSLTTSVGRSLCASCGQVCGEDDTVFDCQSCGCPLAGACCSREASKLQIISEVHRHICSLHRHWNEVMRGREKRETCRGAMLEYLYKYMPHLKLQASDFTTREHHPAEQLHSQKTCPQQQDVGRRDKDGQIQVLASPLTKSPEAPLKQGVCVCVSRCATAHNPAFTSDDGQESNTDSDSMEDLDLYTEVSTGVPV
jgi:tetratricopeptide (TPR) repeat protein